MREECHRNRAGARQVGDDLKGYPWDVAQRKKEGVPKDFVSVEDAKNVHVLASLVSVLPPQE